MARAGSHASRMRSKHSRSEPASSAASAVWQIRLWRTPRGRRRLIRHYVPLVTATLLGTAALANAVDSPSIAYRLSIATAFAGLTLFGLALIIGPIDVLTRGRPPAVSTDLRRDLGILAAITGLVHSAVGLTVYPDIRLYFLYPLREWSLQSLPVRLDDLGVANYMGVAAAALLILLLATSGDWALRAFGARRWKRLQQLSYWAFALSVVHGMLYQRLENRNPPLVALFGAIYLSVAALQIAGYLRRLSGSGRRERGGAGRQRVPDARVFEAQAPGGDAADTIT
jgi:methionine sulfoxide reductase heme-binding subunit